MALISLQEISLAFGGPLLFDSLSLQLEAGERIALLGRNGVGKTTLLRVISGSLPIDEGEIIIQKGIRITLLPQEVPSDIKGNVFDIVLSGLGKRAQVLSDYHHVSHKLHTDHSPQLLEKLGELQHELDATDGWEIHNEIEDIISRMKLDPDAEFAQLSGGQKRRVLLAKALVLHPELLLLDEPTNHLDIDAIDWLEGFLKQYGGTLFFVTHDRAFMTNLATRIVELDRGKVFNWACDYPTFLLRKQMALENEAVQREEFDKKLAQEEIWIRQGVKARRKRNEGRVKALERLRAEKRNQRQAVGQARMQAQESAISGHLVIKVSNLGYSYGDLNLVRDFSTNIMRGDKIGLIGPNGSGKTTLIRLLLGKLEPMKGKVRLGTNLEVAYYDQLREQLNEERTVMENVCGPGDMITINGKPRHVIGYLQDFLFSPDRARSPVKVLSGGERNRLFLARLFTKPSNLLVMDEPTNDLDIETLELLEELLLDYAGTLILVSHDRAFLNNVVTSTLVLEGDGAVNEYPGGYDDWLTQRKIISSQAVKAEPKAVRQKAEVGDLAEGKPLRRKLTYKEERELEGLSGKIEKLEVEREDIYARLSDVTFFQSDPKAATAMKSRLESLEDELLATYQRWEFLEDTRRE